MSEVKQLSIFPEINIMDDEIGESRLSREDELRERLLSDSFACDLLYDHYGDLDVNSEYGVEISYERNSKYPYLAVGGTFNPHLDFGAEDLNISESRFASIYNMYMEDIAYSLEQEDWTYLDICSDWSVEFHCSDYYGDTFTLGIDLEDTSCYKLSEHGVDVIISQLENPTDPERDDSDYYMEWLLGDTEDDIVSDIEGDNLYCLELDDSCFEVKPRLKADLERLGDWVNAITRRFEDIETWKEYIRDNLEYLGDDEE